MGSEINLIDIVQWVTTMFPSLSQYTKIFMPALVMIATTLGVFSDILPEPGQPYPVPDLVDLDIELKGKGRVIYTLVRISRWITIHTNRFINSKAYNSFYRFTNFCSTLIRKVKGQEAKVAAAPISTPKPYRFKILRNKLTDKPK